MCFVLLLPGRRTKLKDKKKFNNLFQFISNGFN